VGLRSIFNMLGPLTNPAGANCQLLGVFAPQLTEMFAEALRLLGARSAFVVHGHDGLDEISVCAPTRVSQLENDMIRTYDIYPEQYFGRLAEPGQMTGGDPAENAAITRKILAGEKGPKRDVVLLNAAAALVAAGGMAGLTRDIRPVLWMAVLIAILWGYSPWFKRKFLAGNLVIALSVGQLPLFTALPSHTTSSTILLLYALLSAGLTGLREITKDLQDIDGDTQAGYDTLPVRWREKKTLLLLKVLHLITWPALVAVAWWLWVNHDLTWHNLLFLLPFAGATWMVFQPNVRSVSAYLKVTLGGGVAVLVWL
jgi:4-hydroxybenzoate polyprenyltransferase